MRSPVVAMAIVAALVVAACGPGATPTASPGMSAPPSASSTGSYTVLPVIVSSEQVVGQNRFLFGFVSAATNGPAGAPDRSASVSAYPKASGPSAAVSDEGTFIWSIPDSVGIYTSELLFSEPGQWVAEFTTSAPGAPSETIPFGFDVKADASAIQVGEAAPSVATPTLDDVGGDVARISTDKAPDAELYEVSEAAALAAGEPFVLAFATPAFCTSATCGPLLETVKAVKSDFPSTTFINVEPYELEETATGLQPVRSADGFLVPVAATMAFGILSEPWIYVVDGSGTVTASFEGVVAEAELREAIGALAAS